MALKIELKRYNGSGYDTLYPKTSWANVEDKPSTYTPIAHNHSAAEVTSGTLGVDRIPTLDYLPLSGGSLTGNINTTTQSTAYTIENVVKFSTTSTPVQTVIYTGIKYLSSTHMPVVRIYGYAYGLNAPIELKIGFYIYGGNLGWAGAVSMGAWRPGIYLFKYNSGGTDYVAIGLSGSCYYLAFQVDVQSVNFSGSIGSSILATGWAANSKTQAEVDAGGAIIPAVGTNNCILVAYKSTLAPLTVQRNGVTLDAYDGSTSKTINIVDSDLDTKNTAGATDTSSKIYLVGATAQTANPQTYSHDTAYVGTDGCVYSNGTKVSVEGHTHSGYEPTITAGTTAQYYRGDKSWQTFPTIPTTAAQVGALSTSGGTVSGDITLSPAGTTQAVQKAIKWKPINSKNPYLGYALDQTDGTFVWSIDGTNYASGLAIGGGSGNLLYKGGIVVTANNISSYAAPTSHTHTLSDVSSLIRESSGGVSIYGYLNDSTTLLFIGDDGTFEHRGNTIITSGNIAGFTPVVPTPIGVSITGSVTLNAPWFSNTFFSVTAASTITIPTDATYNHPVGTETHFYRATSSDVTFSPASGVTLTSEGTKRKINAQYQAATLKKIAANSWVLIGALKA